jgi:hypothetical protein
MSQASRSLFAVVSSSPFSPSASAGPTPSGALIPTLPGRSLSWLSGYSSVIFYGSRLCLFFCSVFFIAERGHIGAAEFFRSHPKSTRSGPRHSGPGAQHWQHVSRVVTHCCPSCNSDPVGCPCNQLDLTTTNLRGNPFPQRCFTRGPNPKGSKKLARRGSHTQPSSRCRVPLPSQLCCNALLH